MNALRLSPHEQQQLDRLLGSYEYYAANCLKIETKDGKLVPFVFNKPQRYIDARFQAQMDKTGRIRALVLKGRQQGCSTYIGGRYYKHASTRAHKRVFILSHQSQTTDKLFSMVDRFWSCTPEVLRPKCATKNKRVMEFEGLLSNYSVGTAGNAEVGRGGTVQYFHGSEVAFYENTDNIDTGVLQSVADMDGTEIVLESTANGASGYFFEKCMMALEGKGDYELIFTPWFWSDEYRRTPPEDFLPTEEEKELRALYKLDDAQLYWRRVKIENFGGRVWKFRQEYPFHVMEAFQSSGERFFPSEQITQAMHNERPDERNAPLVVTADPAGAGKDAMVIGWRRGRDFYKYEEVVGAAKDQMVFVGRLVRIFEEDDPDMMFVDLGYGDGIVSRLRELGYGKRVIGVSFAERAMNPEKYSNKRAEMHDLARDWLNQPGVSIPNDTRVQKQLLAVPQEKLTSNGKLLIPPKDKVKENNNGESPGILDVFILSFAFPVRPRASAGRIVTKDNGGLRKESRQSPLLSMRKRAGGAIEQRSSLVQTMITGR